MQAATDILTSSEIEELFKLRVCVARFGEMDLGGWWNTKGVLAKIGSSVFHRGFPATHFFAQTRVACAVAAARCSEVFAPPGCLTLWVLSPEIEDAIETLSQTWRRNAEDWDDFFSAVAEIDGLDLLGSLTAFGLIDDATVETVQKLRRSAEGKSVPLPGTGAPTPETFKLLAAAFSRGEKGKLAVPYIRATD